tara:strand:+ start:1143 stop:1601 length:459 start_codon:yes stop_codon:yes gene_type:complete
MPKKDWGPITWILFHSLCELIKDEYFHEEKENILNQIFTICYNLPCPSCSQHARMNLKRMKKKNINTKHDLKIIIWQFHNIVNKHTKKPEVDFNILEKYKTAKLYTIIDRFKQIYNTAYISNKYIMYKFHGQKTVENFLIYMQENEHKFIFN